MKLYKTLNTLLFILAILFAVLAGQQSGYATKLIAAYDETKLSSNSHVEKEIKSIRYLWNGNLSLYILLSFSCLVGTSLIEKRSNKMKTKETNIQ